MGAFRTFVAIDIPDEAKRSLMAVQNEFKQLDLNASWVRPENIHLTLKFLGNIDPERVSEISIVLGNSLSPVSAFDVFLDSLGVFPNLRQPRVLWAGINDSGYQLHDTFRKVDSVLYELGFDHEVRPFSPHLTLARIRSQKKREALKNLLTRIDPPDIAIPVNAIRLYRSVLNPKGSQYILLDTFPLTA